MGKIVIPKHSADVEEMNAVLKIHYDANDWVKSREYVEKLKTMINPNLYPSSYPKKRRCLHILVFLNVKLRVVIILLKDELQIQERKCMRLLFQMT